MKPPRKLHIKSYGCQMNVYDAQRMVDTLAPEGFVETASVDDADLVILNTCHIREKASEKVYSELGRLRVVKDDAARQGREMKIAVAGCVAQAEGEEIIRRAPTVDVVVGPQSYHHLPQLLARAAGPRPRAGDRISGRGQIWFPGPAKAGGNSRARHLVLCHRAGRLRQVLHLLRGAVYARIGSVAPGGKDHRRRDAADR